MRSTSKSAGPAINGQSSKDMQVPVTHYLIVCAKNMKNRASNERIVVLGSCVLFYRYAFYH